MSNYDNTNRGQIWGNKDKAQDSDRDFQGSINIEGVEYWLSGYRRKPDDNPNAPAVRLLAKRKEVVHEQGYQQAQQQFQQQPQQANQQGQAAPQQRQQAPAAQQSPQQYQQQAQQNYQQQSPQQQQTPVDDFNDDIPF